MNDASLPFAPATTPPVETFGIARIGACHVGIPIDVLSEVCQVSELRPMLMRSPELCGSFNLRDHMIPVINLNRICGLEDPTHQPLYAVVLRFGEQLLSFLVDEVVGIVQVEAKNRQLLNHGATQPTAACITGLFLNNGSLVSMIDVAMLFARSGIVSVKAPDVFSQMIDAERVPMLSFEAGGAHFAVQATDVYGTVPRQPIEIGAMSSGFCIGSITHHQRKIPILDTVDLLGIGRPSKRAQTEVVVLRCADDRLLGLAVDTIHDIRRMDPRGQARVPGSIAQRCAFFTGVVIRSDGTQVCVLSVEKMLQDTRVAAMARLSSVAAKQSGQTEMAGRPSAGRFLVVTAGRTVAIPLEQVTCIIPPPDGLVPVSSDHSGLRGYFSRAPESVPLVDLTAHLQHAPTASDMTRVLLTGAGEHQVGFQVERVSSIETASWALDGWARQGPESEKLVQLGNGPSRRAVPVVDLAQIAQDHFFASASSMDLR